MINNKIISGELFLDKEFQLPDSPIRNYMLVINFDINKLNILNLKLIK